MGITHLTIVVFDLGAPAGAPVSTRGVGVNPMPPSVHGRR